MPEKKKVCQSRNWCFTDFEMLDFKKIYEQYTDIIRYIGWGKETCPSTGKTHNQGWIQFVNKKRMGGVKKVCQSKKIHLEPCRGDEKANEAYCAKEGNFQSLGVFVTQGQRSDLEQMYKKIKNGATAEELMDENFGLYCRYRGGIKDALEIANKKKCKRFRHVKVEYVHGETGTGKTRWAMEQDPDLFKIHGTSLKWFDGYNGEKTLLIDEYANDVKITKMLGICDGYQLRLPIKGGFTYANWDRVIITSNIHYDDLHFQASQAHRDALKRRVTRVIHMEYSN